MSAVLDIIGSSIIGGLLVLTLLRMNVTATENQSFFADDLAVQLNLRNTVNIIESDFRKIGYGAVVDDTTGELHLESILIEADSNEIIFWADVNADGRPDTISYSFKVKDTTTENPFDKVLYRRYIVAGSPDSSMEGPVSRGVTNFKLTYIGQIGDTMSVPLSIYDKTQVQLLQIDLNLQSPFLTYDPAEAGTVDTVEYLKRSALWRESRLIARNLTR